MRRQISTETEFTQQLDNYNLVVVTTKKNITIILETFSLRYVFF